MCDGGTILSDLIPNALTSDYLSGAASAATLIALTAGLVRFARARATCIGRAIRTTVLVREMHLPRIDIHIVGSGRKGNTLAETDILLENRTKITLTADDFVELPRVEFEPGEAVYGFGSLEVTGGSKGALVIDQSSITISGLQLLPSGILAFRFHHSSTKLPNFSFLSKHYGAGRHIDPSPIIERAPFAISLLLLSALFAFVIAQYVFSIIGHSVGSDFQSLLFILTFCGATVSLLGFGAVMIERISQMSPRLSAYRRLRNTRKITGAWRN